MLSGDAEVAWNERRVWFESRGFIKRERTRLKTPQMMMNQKDPEDAYANEPLAHENWRAQYEEERQKEQVLNGLASVAICIGVEEEPGLFPASTMFCHSFDSRALSGVYTNFRTFSPKCLSSSGNKRKHRKLFSLEEFTYKYKLSERNKSQTKHKCSTMEN